MFSRFNSMVQDRGKIEIVLHDAKLHGTVALMSKDCARHRGVAAAPSSAIALTCGKKSEWRTRRDSNS